ncbi:hypothetical protein FDP41_010322 [Naegleria fowleri]|uniref:TLC domain-containing protein n=1 Tax=Naegleria fowleri TaxID=5763 RepID=A0A6A5C1D8_NAEFO|nr:uncharacterized protein FDP41_010322 [Naegleria fowleri]KAF0983257.1 hypothetical protein FDP41_010322 [Naegleria fowleri]CAG4708463.1 unnamed protein product [Naegleria fowleri]
MSHLFPLNLYIYIPSTLSFGILILLLNFLFRKLQEKYKGKFNSYLFRTHSSDLDCRELAFSTTNYIHAVISGLWGLYLFYYKFLNSEGVNKTNHSLMSIVKEPNHFFFSYNDSISNLMSFTLGYLTVDLFCYLFLVVLGESNLMNAIFHFVIVIAFSLYFVNGTGAIPALFGEISEIASIWIGQEELMENLLHDYSKKLYFVIHSLVNTLSFLITRTLMSVYLGFQLFSNMSDLVELRNVQSTTTCVIVYCQCVLLVLVIVMNFYFTVDCLRYSLNPIKKYLNKEKES